MIIKIDDQVIKNYVKNINENNIKPDGSGKTLTVVWNMHGDGKLIGVFDDDKMVEQIKEKVDNNNEGYYVKFYKVKLNEIIGKIITY